jgi:hypothetical protein
LGKPAQFRAPICAERQSVLFENTFCGAAGGCGRWRAYRMAYPVTAITASLIFANA